MLGFLFCCVFCCLAQSGKNDFCVGKIIFLKLESGGCWDLLGLAKSDFWVGKIIFVKLGSCGCWDLLGFLFFFGVYTAACKIAGQGKWRLLGFAGISSFAVSTAAWRAARQKNDFWVWKIIFVKLESGNCWDFFFCGVYCCLAGCPAKK